MRAGVTVANPVMVTHPVRGMKHGENGHLRVGHEDVWVLQKPGGREGVHGVVVGPEGAICHK